MPSRRYLLFRDGTNPTNGEYIKGHFTYAEIKKGDVVYMQRWYLLVFRQWFSMRVHHIRMPDLDRWPHDHPWSFLSLILRGGYDEDWCTPAGFQLACADERPQLARTGERGQWVGYVRRRVHRLSFHRATDLHKIVSFHRGRAHGAWTFLITGPERGREWGFMTDHGWLSRKELGLGAAFLGPRTRLAVETLR